MPLYEYQCKKCGHRFERIRKFSDPPVKKCPECGGKVAQLMSAPAVHFKGSGWYVSDYARKGKAAAGEGPEPASGKPEQKVEKADKAETKPKSEPKKSPGKK